MKFIEFGDNTLPHVLLIHGAGWSWWLYLREARLLMDRYHVILPVLDGHGEEAHVPYESTEVEADKILAYVDECCGGHLHALGGVSLGGQIAVELLSRRADIADRAVIESGVCVPQPFLLGYSKFIYKLMGKWMFSQKFNRWALKAAPKRLKLPEEVASLYLRDIVSMKPATFTRIFDSYFRYSLKESLRNTGAACEYWYGSREPKAVRASAEAFRSYVPASKIIKLKRYVHSEISAYHPEEWVERFIRF